MTRRVSAIGLAHIKQWEGCKLRAYQDVGGVWTIGYGSTGPHVKPGMEVTQAQAEALLKKDLSRFEGAVDRMVLNPLTDHEFDALVSFAFNVGIGAFQNSTLLKKLNAGDYDSVPKQLARWVHAGGRRVPGLVNRRAAEAGLWAKESHVSSRTVPAEPEMRAFISKETVSWGAGIAGTLGTVFMGSGPIQWALAAVIVLAFTMGAFFFVKSRMEH